MLANPLFANQNSLPKRFIPKLNRAVSFIGLGTVELGRDWGIASQDSLHPSDEQARGILKSAYSHSIDVIDTATSYQLSEERIGRYLPRQQYHYLLITKPGEYSIKADDPRCQVAAYDRIYCKKPGGVYDFSRAAIFRDINQSLKKLNVPVIDVALLHLANETAEEILLKGEALQALKDLKKQGKIRFIGVSVNGKAIGIALNQEIDVIELEYSLINRSNEKYINLASKKGMAVIVRGGLGTGLLTPHVAKHLNDPHLPYGNKVRALLRLVNNDYDKLTQLALAFLYQNKNISSVIIGADRAAFIDKDIKLLTQFKDDALLANAIKIADRYPTPPYFTEMMGEYYFK